MSQESYNAFKAKLATDETLSKELFGALGSNATADDLAAFARRHGYDFNPNEINQVVELSDDDLVSVAGGTSQTKGSPTLMLHCANGTHIKIGTITV